MSSAASSAASLTNASFSTLPASYENGSTEGSDKKARFDFLLSCIYIENKCVACGGKIPDDNIISIDLYFCHPRCFEGAKVILKVDSQILKKVFEAFNAKNPNSACIVERELP